MRRVALLSQEMDAGLQAWQLRQQKLKQENALKPKGASVKSPLPSQ
uniref:39S ribosomal protein L52, mitochondrial n=1 Tax=Rhinopithecus roxellana TaxID=61622 RepID=A0A2K6P7K3_RHIRO